MLASEWLAPLWFGKSATAVSLPAILAIAFIVLSQITRGETLKDLGWRIDNFVRASFLLFPLMAVGTIYLVAIGWCCGSLQAGKTPLGPQLIWIGLSLFVWGLIQQYALQSSINRRAQEIWGPGMISILITAAVFAMLHLPNFWLMTATFFGGLMWAFVYQRAPNLWALAISHAIMTAVLAVMVPYPALHGLRVGFNYFR